MSLVAVWLERGANAVDLKSDMPAAVPFRFEEDNVAVVMVGIDPHKASHTAVALASDETRLGQVRVRAGTLARSAVARSR